MPDVPTPAVIVDMNNSDNVYIGTDIGVFVSTDGGDSWQDFNVGLPDAVQAMDLNITYKNNVIRVMTHGNGAYETKLLSQFPTHTNTIPSIVTDYRFEQNYPNPFNSTTSIKYQIPELGLVTLIVYDVLGNEVATLVNEEKPTGSYEITWNAENLPSGVYFYRLQAGSFIDTKKMILLK